MSHLYTDFLAPKVENTGILKKASYTQFFFRKDVNFGRNYRQTNKIVNSQPKIVLKPGKPAEYTNSPKFDYLKRIYTVIKA